MKTSETIFLDWDGTLSQSRFWQRWRDNPADNQKYKDIERVLFLPGQALLQEWMLGKLSAENAVEYVAGQTNVPYSELISGLRESCQDMQIIQGALELVDKARSIGHKVFIATDNMDTFTRWTVPALELESLFDGILSSAEIGALKKDLATDGSSRFFANTFLRHSIEPSNAILIDDSANTQVVEQFGMQFCKVSSPADTIAVMQDILQS